MSGAAEAERRVADAEANLGLALRRLRAVRRDALRRGFDAEKHNPVIAAYRQAASKVLAARLAWASAGGGSETAPAGRPDALPPGATAPIPLRASPRPAAWQAAPLHPASPVRIVRWLRGAVRLLQSTRA